MPGISRAVPAERGGVITVNDGKHVGGRGVAGAGGLAFCAASGAAESRRSESAGPHAETSTTKPAVQRWYRRDGAEGRLRSDPHLSSHRRRGGRAGEPDAALWFRLVDRDRRLLAVLFEHKVLTTNQIAAIEFLSVRRAQDRLRQLRELGVVFAFRESYLHGGTSQTRYALGYLGARLIAAQRAVKPPAPKAYTESLERLALWPKLDHQLGVNDFFCALAAHRNPARLHVEGREGEVSGLTHWWSEKRCTEFFWKHQNSRETQLRPDGYGCWEDHGRTMRFFLEHDTGTESLTKVTGKIADYSAFPTDQFGVLLFSVHSSRREITLRTALHRALTGSDPGFVIATAARDHDHPDGPAGPIWGLWTPHRDDIVPFRHRLAELPQRGPSVAHSTSNTDQPLNEAAFEHTDREMLHRIDTPQPEPGSRVYPDDDDDLDDVDLYDSTDIDDDV